MSTRDLRRYSTSSTILTTTIAAALLLSGCAPAGDTPAGETPAATGSGEETASRLPAAEGTTEYPLTITTELGEIVIPERPERIVAADSYDIEIFAALDVLPVGTDEQYEFYPWVFDELPGEIETVWEVGDVAYPEEEIAATEPDLIVSLWETDTTTTEKISGIAPVLGAPLGTVQASWQERVLFLGEVLDLSDRAQEFIDEYDATFEQLRAEHPEFQDLSVDLTVFWGGDYGAGYLSRTGSDPYVFLTEDLGFAASPTAELFTDGTALSDELVQQLQGDILIISNQASDQDEYQAWFTSPLLQGVTSVQDGRVLSLRLGDDFVWYFEDELTDFRGHFARAFSTGPFAKFALAELLVPLVADVAQ